MPFGNKPYIQEVLPLTHALTHTTRSVGYVPHINRARNRLNGWIQRPSVLWTHAVGRPHPTNPGPWTSAPRAKRRKSAPPDMSTCMVQSAVVVAVTGGACKARWWW